MSTTACLGEGRRMIKPYMAVGLIPTVRGIRKRSDIKINIEHLHHLVKADLLGFRVHCATDEESIVQTYFVEQ